MLADWLAAGVIGALVFAWFGHAFLNYDTFYALVWGSDLAHGRTPDYTVPVAPTPHPLAQLVGIVLTPFGSGAEDIMLALGLLGLGMLAVGLFRLGQEIAGAWVGVAAAVILMTRVPILNFGIRGYVDLPTAAFVVWAVVLETRKRRRGVPVLILLTLAGLLRPEAWLYAGAYGVWLLLDPEWRSGGNLWKAIGLAAAAPLIWMFSDLLITGSPVHSLSGTHDLAAELGRRTGITELPSVAPRRMGEILRLPEGLAALAGIGFGLAFMRHKVALPLVVIGLNGLAYTAFAIARLPLLGRYLFVAASMFAVFAGLGILGWTALEREHRGRTAWLAVGVAAMLAVVVFFPLQQADRLDTLKDDIAARDRIQADLHELVQRPDVKRGLRACPRVYVPSHRLVPLIGLWADVRPSRIVTLPDDRSSPDECLVFPANRTVARLAVLDPREPDASLGAYTGPVDARNRSWVFSG